MKQSRQIRKLRNIVKKVRACQEQIKDISDRELQHLTVEFKERLEQGETLDDLLPEAFAAVCEADRRILGMNPHDVQIMGGIALHQGYLAEMNTGEGKTLVATMPLYLNALTGKSCILMTTNEYLAGRDAKEMGQVYTFMGLTAATTTVERGREKLSNDEKREIYAADIVYTTHGGFGFDYLFNNLVKSAEERFLRELYYVIIDEADSVLLDSATTPLVISGSPRVQSNLYELTDFFVTTLKEDIDYKVEDKKVWLTEAGIRYAEEFFEIDNFYGREYFEINRHVTLALRAHKLFEIEKDYMISDKGELTLLDNGSGRMMSGVKLRGGQHQSLEQKEKLKVSQESRSMASVTYPNLFKMFTKMSGMSGTISDATDELMDLYDEPVVVIPPNKKFLRKDMPDLYYRDAASQITDAINAALEIHKTGQPVLIVVSTIKQTEVVSKLLLEEQVPHSVLNANNAYWEAEMIKEAGQLNAVTVSTGIAGRGTDIKLGKGVKELGGLAVIGIGRMANVRQERQARGRAGRQGDPGFSQFYVSLEDEVVITNGPKDIEKYSSGERFISKRKIKRWIDYAQKLGDENAALSRKKSKNYDEVLQCQRELIYATRNKLLDGGVLEEERFTEIAQENIQDFIKEEEMTQKNISRFILDNLSYRLDQDLTKVERENPAEIEQYLMNLVSRSLKEQRCRLGERMNEFMRVVTLNAIDEAWVEQVDYLQQLQFAVSGRSSAQRNLVYEYQKEALESFRRMEKIIFRNIMRYVLLSDAKIDEKTSELHILFP